MINPFSDEYFMQQAFIQAQIAYEQEEIPVGAVIVSNNQIIAKAHNQVELLKDCTAHAELLSITAASNALGSKYLNDCTLYVTLEPCTMCAGAIFWSGISKIVIGAKDEKRGFRTTSPNLMRKHTTIIEGVLDEKCSLILNKFFIGLRDRC